MKKKGIIISIVGILLVVAIGIFCLPVLQVKHLLKEVSDYERFQYELSIELDKAQLSQKETQLLETIAKLLGITEEDIFCWTAKGSVYDNTIYAKLYCRGFEHAVTELYLTEEQQLINIQTFYEFIQDYVEQQVFFLGMLFPSWNGASYISVEQMEEIFEVDLSEMFTMDTFILEENIHSKGLLLLLGMEKSKGEQGELQFKTAYEGYDVTLHIQKQEEIPVIETWIVNNNQTSMIKECNLKVLFTKVEEIQVPNALVSEESMNILKNIWGMMKSIDNKN